MWRLADTQVNVPVASDAPERDCTITESWCTPAGLPNLTSPAPTIRPCTLLFVAAAA